MRSILGEIDDAEAAVGSSTQELHGTVHVLATPVLASYVLAPNVGHWRQRYPRWRWTSPWTLFPQTRVDEFDVTFMAADEGYDANVVARALSSSEWILCASPTYLRRAGTPRRHRIWNATSI